jgi:hypothetical protein
MHCLIQMRVLVQTSLARASRGLVVAAAGALLAGGLPVPSIAQQPGQATFPSPKAAVSALIKAVQGNDEQAMLHVLGPDARRLVSSGDPVEDAQNRANFIERYRQMHRLVTEPDGTVTVYVGAANWPMPIPLAHTGHTWYFDTGEGKREILYRRIGRNELSAIRVCEELAGAEKEYHTMRGEYAGRIYSTPGRHDGLYWETAAGEPRSPIGPLVGSAVAAGYAPAHSGTRTPYRGYYFHHLTGQGPAAPGGAKGFSAAGKMTGGFGFVAYPAEYRSSGVMTFIVGSDGVVYQKDLGRETTQIAKAMKVYDPDSSWQRANEEETDTAGR